VPQASATSVSISSNGTLSGAAERGELADGQDQDEAKKQAKALAAAGLLDVSNTDIPGQIAAIVGDEVRRASAVVTRVLQGQMKNSDPAQAVVHTDVATHVRTLVLQSENPLDIVNVLVKSFDAILSDPQKSDAQKDAELRPLVESFVKTELAIKDAQLATKIKLLAQLPQLAPLSASCGGGGGGKPSRSRSVSVDSIFCVFMMEYFGLAERSLCFMGEASLHALFTQAYDLINLERAQVPFQHIVLMHKLRDELKRREEELVRRFEVQWHIPYAFMGRHKDPAMRSQLQSAMTLQHLTNGSQDQGGRAMHLLVSRTMTEAVALYKEGVARLFDQTPPLLCARVLLAMHKVKQILKTSDSFHQIKA